MQKNSIQHCFLIGLLFILSSCSDDKNYSESYLRGKSVYKDNCAKCHHNTDPSKMGVNAPDIAGSSLETIKSMLLTGKPPVGQTPKDDRKMDPLPHLIEEAPYLFEYIDSFKK